MKKILKHYPIIIPIVLIVICCMAFVAKGKSSVNYLAQSGVLDFHAWDWTENPVVELNGEWEFYPNSLKQGLPKDNSVIKTVPHLWEQDEDLNFSPFGFGTYRLKINGLKPSGIYGLQITDEVTAYRLYVNNAIVAENGVISPIKSTYIPQWLPVQSIFEADENGNAEFVMEICNYDYNRGGFWNNIKIGQADEIFKEASSGKILDMFLFTSILVIACLNLFFHFLYHKRSNAMLYLSLICFCMGIRVLLTGQRLITNFVPGFHWYLLIRLEYLFGYLLLPLFGLFTINLFSDYPYRRLLNKLFLVMAASCFLLTLFMPNVVYMSVITPYKWATVLYIISFTYSMFKVNIRKKQETAFMLIAAAGTFIAILKEVIGGTMSWLPFATLNVIICFSLTSFFELQCFIQENELLGMKAFIDPLTGLFNRTYLKEMEINNCIFNQDKDKYIMFLDLDSFKSINDTFGHKVGDFVLRETGQRIKKILRNTDVICRFGGDEFIIVIEEYESNIEVIADRILQTIQEPFCQDGKDYLISASIGIAKIDADSTDFDTVIRKSDKAMYEAKRNGRNQYSLWNKQENFVVNSDK